MKKLLLVLLTVYFVTSHGQTLYVPSGTSGIGSSINGNVGIGTTSPRGVFDVASGGDIFLSQNTVTGSGQSLYLPGHIYLSPISSGSNISYLQARRSDNSGTTSLRIRTVNSGSVTEAVHIEGNGNVGIGTTVPAVKLHVMGPATGSGAVIFADGGGDVMLNTGGSLFFDGTYSYASGNYIRPVAINTQAFFTSGQERLRLTPTGNVGIGTTSPGAPLDINGATNVSQVLQEWSITGVHILSAGYTLGGSNPAYLTTENSTRPLQLQSNGGNVGIGTTNPGSYKLAVEGKIGAREVNVIATNPWPDYVFEKNYKLPSLEEIKNYIDQNQHLPEVPSAKEVEKNGVNLGEMNALLLKKIEELTLYMLKQQQQIDEQKKEIDQLKANEK